MSEPRKGWTSPYAATEWIILCALVLGACMAGAFAFIVYTGVTAAFGENDLLSLAPVVIGVILFVVLGRRRRRSVMSERDGGRRYSFRSAVTGSTLVARRAGP